MTEAEGREEFEGWAILELMGHRKLAGYVRPATIAGSGVIRIDVPARLGGVTATQYYSPAALYALTPVAEELARRLAALYQPEPITRWELPAEAVHRVDAQGRGLTEGPDDDELRYVDEDPGDE